MEYPRRKKRRVLNNYKCILRMTKIFTVFLLTGLITVQANSYSQKTLITVNLQNTLLKEAFNEIESKSDYVFVVSGNISSEVKKRVSVNIKEKDIEHTLIEILHGSDLNYKIFNRQVVIYKNKKTPPQAPRIFSSATDQKQNPRGLISGIVVDKNGEPLAGATMQIKGLDHGYATDSEGRFQFELATKGESITLIFSYIGFRKKEVKIKRGKFTKVVMEEESTKIAQVVVNGMFKRKEEGFTGATTKTTGEEIKAITSGNALNAIQQIDPSFKITENNISGANPNIIPEFNLRGKAGMGNYNIETQQTLRGDLQTRPNQPLFVLDGIIGVSISKIMDIDPSLIKSVTLLKDASALVLYGSRAANGVVVIETKAPAQGRLRVGYYGLMRVEVPDLRDYNLLNAEEKLELERIGGLYRDTYDQEYDALVYQAYTNKVLDVARGVNTYWLAQPLKTAFHQQHTLTIEGGDTRFRYKLSLNVGEQPGVMRKTGVFKKGGTMDIRYRSNKILISNQFFADYVIGKRKSPFGRFSNYAALNPYYRLYDENGDYQEVLEYQYVFGTNAKIPAVLNPMYNARFNQKDESEELRIGNRFEFEYRPIRNLTLSLGGSLSKAVEDVNIFIPAQHGYFKNKYDVNKKGRFNWTNKNGLNYSVNIAANYNKYWKNHFFSTYFRQEINSFEKKYIISEQTGYPNDYMDEYFLGTISNKATGSENISRSTGFLLSTNYAYKSRYSFDLSMRMDGSSEFGKNNRFAPFWAGGLRWNMKNESFLKDNKNINDLTLRATYGTLGSQGFSPYQSLQMYRYNLKTYLSSNVVGATLQSIGNSDLKWQNTDMWNFGLNFDLFHSFFSGRIDYYYKYTSNLVLDFTLQPSSGFRTISDNLGNIVNRGVETSLRFMPYNNRRENISASFTVNVVHNTNKIVKIAESLKAQNDRALKNIRKYPLPQYIEGQSITQIYAVKSLGIDPITGNEVFLKRNGEKTYVYDSKEAVPLGDREPKINGSVLANFIWKDFSLTLTSLFHCGGYTYNSTLSEKIENTPLHRNVDRRALTDRWKRPGDVVPYKKLSIDAHDTRANSRFVMKDNEFLLKAISLQYRMTPAKYNFLRGLNVSMVNASLYFEDILRLSTVKKERGIEYPFSRQVAFSLGLTF